MAKLENMEDADFRDYQKPFQVESSGQHGFVVVDAEAELVAEYFKGKRVAEILVAALNKVEA